MTYTVTNSWPGQAVTARNPQGYNVTIPPGQSVSFGLQAILTGTNAVPAAFTLNGNTACT